MIAIAGCGTVVGIPRLVGEGEAPAAGIGKDDLAVVDRPVFGPDIAPDNPQIDGRL